jgi:hypothetical protein
VENLFSKATAMKNDEGRSPGICFLKWTHPMSEHSEDNPSLSAGSKASTMCWHFLFYTSLNRRFKRVFKTKKANATQWHGF